MHKRLRWCRHSDRLSKALAAWNSQMPRRIQTTEILVETKFILEALTRIVGEILRYQHQHDTFSCLNCERTQTSPCALGRCHQRKENKHIFRCRVIGKELKSQTKEVCFAHEVFSALLPWATVKSPLSFLVTDGVSDPEEQLEVGIFDISRAHFMRASGHCQGTRRWGSGWTAEPQDVRL